MHLTSEFRENLIIPRVHKVIKNTLKILQHLLQDFERQFDRFVDLRQYRVKFSRSLLPWLLRCYCFVTVVDIKFFTNLLLWELDLGSLSGVQNNSRYKYVRRFSKQYLKRVLQPKQPGVVCIDRENDIQKHTLCEKCPYLEFPGPFFPAFGLNTERYSVSLRIQSECEKTRTKKTPNTDTFHAVTYYKYYLGNPELCNMEKNRKLYPILQKQSPRSVP